MKPASVSFVFPMYNEAAGIRSTVERADALARELSDDYEIIVVDDASTDASGTIINDIAETNGRVVPIHLAVNSKFGGALRRGLQAATKDIVIYTDSDFPVEERDVKEAIRLFDAGADVVTGYSLVLKDSSIKRIIMSKVYNFLVESLFGLHIRDINSGFKMFRKEVLAGMRLRSSSPFIDVELFAETKRQGYRIAQYGLIFQLRTKGKSTISRLDVVWRTFFDMIAYRFF